jgi:hypothetical protein
MDREVNLNSIRALEEQIGEHEGEIIQLKRTRNSLLSVSKLPPEILGSIFHRNVIPLGDFGPLPEASHNFLPVCHHWYRVASNTPSLWGFWGNSIRDWRRRHARCRTAPLMLVFRGRYGELVDDELHDALQDCAARDVIRQVHLRGFGVRTLLESVISSIIIEGKEPRSIGLDSLVLQNLEGSPNIDISNLFSQYHFPKLRRLELQGFSAPWDLLGSRTTHLTTLSLTADGGQEPRTTMAQVLSVLSANPDLRSLALFNKSVPHTDGEGTPTRIRLHHLETLRLSSTFRRVFGFLDRLEHPDEMDDLDLFLSGCPSDIPQTLGPYLRNHIRRRSADKLRLTVYPDRRGFHLMVGDLHDDAAEKPSFVRVGGSTDALGVEEANTLCFDIIAQIPQEKIVDVTTDLPILHSELRAQMRNLTHLHITDMNLRTWFTAPAIQETHVFWKVLPSLHSITISRARGDDWGPLREFLARRATRNQIPFLILRDCPYMNRDAARGIRPLVGEFQEWIYEVEDE